MKTQAVSMQSAYITRNSNNSNPKFGSCQYVAVPVDMQEDSFTSWAGKNILTASAVSVIWDLGTNVAAKFSKTTDKVSLKQMLFNIPKVAALVLLVSGVFKAVSNVMDR